MSNLETDAMENPPEFKLFGRVIHSDTSQQPRPEKPDQKETTAADPPPPASPPAEEARVPARLACPRCRSKETKFCYFNNYNVNQPRHFCRSCRRYWTAGGALRNVPVGAGARSRASGGGGKIRPSPYSDPVRLDRWVTNPAGPAGGRVPDSGDF